MKVKSEARISHRGGTEVAEDLRVGEFNHKRLSAAEPQPKIGISRAKAQRPRRKTNSELGVLARVDPCFRDLLLSGKICARCENF